MTIASASAWREGAGEMWTVARAILCTSFTVFGVGLITVHLPLVSTCHPDFHQFELDDLKQ